MGAAVGGGGEGAGLDVCGPLMVMSFGSSNRVPAFPEGARRSARPVSSNPFLPDTSTNPPEPENVVEIPKFKSSSDELSPQAFFSIEEVDFGEVSSGEIVSRVFILFNNSVSSSFKFEFDRPRFVW